MAIERLYEDLSALSFDRYTAKCEWLDPVLTNPKLAYAIKRLHIAPSYSLWEGKLEPLLISAINLKEYVSNFALSDNHPTTMAGSIYTRFPA